jgi:transketolase
MKENILDRAADNIRILAMTMVEKAKSGHPGGAMGGADFINVLYSKYIVYDPDDPHWFLRDRFFLDPGHMSPMLYSVLALTGKFTIEELQQFRQWGSVTPGHPELNVDRGIENTSGPLGQGHVMAVGCAIAERFLAARFGEILAHKTYAFISDGGIQEEISQGAGRIAGFLGLSNLIMFYDSNRVQLSTDVDAVTMEDTAAKYRAWNWNVLEIDGSNPSEISNALEVAIAEKERPTLIIGHTVMGHGCVTAEGENFEGQCSTHGQPISKSGASYEKTVAHLGGSIENPWAIFPEVAELYAHRRKRLSTLAAQRKAEFAAWERQNPEKSSLLQSYIDGKLPDIDYSAIAHKPNIATRASSADVLSVLGEKVGNMIVSSADLANSDKTDAFLKKTGAIKPHDFNGAFLHAGVSELTMTAIMNGIVLHGGMFAACGTFFVFSDYMKPAIRLSALMQLPVKFVWTHDAFRVGEDGPTHQPIEHEAQIRLLEQVKNDAGNNSLLVLRPADSAETTVAWQMAMENKKSPTALILSRQSINDLPTATGNRFADATKMRSGAYTVEEVKDAAVTLVGNGSEVSTLCAASEMLKKDGIACRIVSIPSVGLFLNQSEDYRNSVLPVDMPVFGLTAGLPSALLQVVGAKGTVFGLNHFGASAPYDILDEKFGFTPENVANQIRNFVKLKKSR